MFFFFQAEDGIRDVAVTGVQTCALPHMNRNLCGWPGGRPQYEGCELKRSCAAALLVFLAAAARTGFVPARLRRCRPDLGGGSWVQFGVWCSVGCVLRSVLPKARSEE